MRFFIDSSVFFAMATSSQGGSRELLRHALAGSITLVISPYVLEETEEKLARKKPHVLEVFHRIQALDVWEMVNPATSEIAEATQHVND